MKTQEVFDNATTYIDHHFLEACEHIDEWVNTYGSAPCPMCVADEMVGENETGFLSELFDIGKDDPVAALAAMRRAHIHMTTGLEITHKVTKLLEQLFEEELEQTN